MTDESGLGAGIRSLRGMVRSAFRRDEPDLSELSWTRDGRPATRKQFESVMPQAEVLEGELEFFEERDWRGYFSNKLFGHGLEIGPLHRPLVRHPKMAVDYIDRCTVAELRMHYPELKDLPLVEPQIIGDAETLAVVPNETYDFVVAAHVIEHMRDPIGALRAWHRVIKAGGLLYLIAPDKRAIFDKHRVRTTLEHLIVDYHRPSRERDYEHFLDYALHVHGKHGEEAICEADRLVEIDYSIHFHTFIPSDVKRLARWFDETVAPLTLLEGPVMAPRSDEFHLLLKVG